MADNPLMRANGGAPQSTHHFTRPAGKLTREDLELYAQELNHGPMRGWYVKKEEGLWTLARA